MNCARGRPDEGIVSNINLKFGSFKNISKRKYAVTTEKFAL